MDSTRHNIREQWEFRCEQTRWRWRRRDCDGGVISVSAETFASLRAAIEDARRNGFDDAARRA